MKIDTQSHQDVLREALRLYTAELSKRVEDPYPTLAVIVGLHNAIESAEVDGVSPMETPE